MIKYKFLYRLYVNKYFYGNVLHYKIGIGFMIIDIISGPLSLILNIYYLTVNV